MSRTLMALSWSKPPLGEGISANEFEAVSAKKIPVTYWPGLPIVEAEL
jgi:hypothetical protein